MDFSDFMLPTDEAENVDFGSLAQQMMANLSGNGLEGLAMIEPAGAQSPTSPSPASMTQFSNGPLIEDALLEEDEDEESDAPVATSSRPTSTSSQSQLVIDLSKPLKRSSLASKRSSQRSSVHTLSSIADTPPRISDDSAEEAFRTPPTQASEIFDALAAPEEVDGAEDDAEAGDETVLEAGDETIFAELPPSPSQIM